MRNKFKNHFINDNLFPRLKFVDDSNSDIILLDKDEFYFSFFSYLFNSKKRKQRRTAKEYFESYSDFRNADQESQTIEEKLTFDSILILQEGFFVFLKDGEIVGLYDYRIQDFLSRINLILSGIKELISFKKKKCFLMTKKSIDNSLFFNEPTGLEVGSFSFLDYIKRYIARIKGRFDDFLKNKYRRKPYLRIT